MKDNDAVDSSHETRPETVQHTFEKRSHAIGNHWSILRRAMNGSLFVT